MEEDIRAQIVQLQEDPRLSLYFQEALKQMETSLFSEAIQVAPALERFPILFFKV